jgi:hypothetical protein
MPDNIFSNVSPTSIFGAVGLSNAVQVISQVHDTYRSTMHSGPSSSHSNIMSAFFLDTGAKDIVGATVWDRRVVWDYSSIGGSTGGETDRG